MEAVGSIRSFADSGRLLMGDGGKHNDQQFSLEMAAESPSHSPAIAKKQSTA